MGTGDYNKDDNCEKDLFCYRRSKFKRVASCTGQDKSGKDYCFGLANLNSLGNF